LTESTFSSVDKRDKYRCRRIAAVTVGVKKKKCRTRVVCVNNNPQLLSKTLGDQLKVLLIYNIVFAFFS
jgi:hypothetical protein